MTRNIIVLEDDSFVEEEIADDYEELREFRDARWSRDAGELDAADLVSMSWATDIATLYEEETGGSGIRSSRPRRS